MPGDEIIGFITKGRGLSVHRKDCSELINMAAEKQERLIEVEWAKNIDSVYPVDIEIVGMDRPRLVSDIMNVIMETRTHVLEINARVAKNRIAKIHLKIEARNLEHLKFVLQRIGRIKDVTVVKRMQSGGAN